MNKKFLITSADRSHSRVVEAETIEAACDAAGSEWVSANGDRMTKRLANLDDDERNYWQNGRFDHYAWLASWSAAVPLVLRVSEIPAADGPVSRDREVRGHFLLQTDRPPMILWLSRHDPDRWLARARRADVADGVLQCVFDVMT